MHLVRTYTHAHMHARGNMCEHTCMWILFYILHNLHYRYGRTRTHLCIYVFSVASLIVVVVASPVDVVIAAPAAAAVLEVA